MENEETKVDETKVEEEEELKPLDEPEPEKPLVEEEKPVEEEEEKQEEEKQAEPNPLIDALHLVMNASEEDIANLPEEEAEAFRVWAAKNVDQAISTDLKWVKNAITTLSNVMKKNLDENEEFRVLAKNTLQKNVAILEDQAKYNLFNKMFKNICQIYSTYCFILNSEIADPKLRSNIEGIFEELDMFFEDYEVEKVTAKVGDEFDPTVAKIAVRVPTDDPALDKKIALMKAPGFKKGKVVLTYMRADIYIYQEPTAQ